MNHSIDSIKNNHARGFVTTVLASTVVLSASIVAFAVLLFPGGASAASGNPTSLVATTSVSQLASEPTNLCVRQLPSDSHLKGALVPTSIDSTGLSTNANTDECNEASSDSTNLKGVLLEQSDITDESNSN